MRPTFSYRSETCSQIPVVVVVVVVVVVPAGDAAPDRFALEECEGRLRFLDVVVDVSMS